MRREVGTVDVGGFADKKTEEAIAFKNRLVEYDRNAAQRTQVVDDQSDFFEIDSNAWLSPEVRGAAAFTSCTSAAQVNMYSRPVLSMCLLAEPVGGERERGEER